MTTPKWVTRLSRRPPLLALVTGLVYIVAAFALAALMNLVLPAALTGQGLSNAIYFLTGGILLWYTIETHAMRKEITRQIDLQVKSRPSSGEKTA